MTSFEMFLAGFGVAAIVFLFINSMKETNKKKNPRMGSGTGTGEPNDEQGPEGPQTPQKFEG